MSSPVAMIETIAVEDHPPRLGEGAEVTTQNTLIFRLHTEIMQLIFELAVSISSPSHRIKAAILLSEVCRQWRKIATDTPTLWATFEVTARPDVLSGEFSLVMMAISRIKAAPATINIDEVDIAHLVNRGPEHWAFFKLSNLLDLKIKFREDVGLEYFTNLTFNALQYSPLRRLSLSTNRWTQNQPFLNLHDVYRLFPNLTHLTLNAVSIAEVEGPLWISLIYCEIQRSSVTLHTVNTAFPNLERLHLLYIPLRVSMRQSDPQKCPGMRNIRLRGTGFLQDYQLSLTSYPNILSLYSTSASSEHLIEFLRRHPSMKHIDCFLTDLHVVECAKVAPQLAHVCLTTSIDPFVHWEKYGLATPPFPHLKTLLLGDRMDPFTDVEFEALVKARFLPAGHPQSLLEDSSLHVEELRIIRKEFVDWTIEDWANHPLCSEAKITVVPYEEEVGSNHIMLQWM